MCPPRADKSAPALVLAVALMWGAFPGSAPADSYETRIYTTARSDDPPHIDGRLDDAVWDRVDWATDFIQLEPTEGVPPSQPTAFKILYDNEALYIAYRCYDSEPDRIFAELARRDEAPGDWVEINIDSYHDKLTAFSFTASVSGTRTDEFISEDGDDWDDSWNPVWQLATRIDGDGWTAEVMIPLSQLRFSHREDHVWGIQVTRYLFRADERSVWQPKSKNDSGWVSRFGELRGLRSVDPGRRLELLPYALVQTEHYKRDPQDPFGYGRDGSASSGLDGKFGVTNDLTLDVTFNPDFGQVEADPSVVNLTEFETFFDERRPFFIEGQSILSFPVARSSADDEDTPNDLFYSRRIGREPILDPDYDYADLPDNTSILGASKLTGKTHRGLSVAILESVTAREKGTLVNGNVESQETIEPLSNYFVARLQQDLDDGNSSIGGMFTATHRKLDQPQLSVLHKDAYAGGIDVLHQWNNRNWQIAATGAVSQVRGSKEALIETQRSAQHYFQRPDNSHESVDSTRTSLLGHAGSVRLGRSGGGNLRFEIGTDWISPRFEINDLGYLESADGINEYFWAGYAKQNPFGVFRSMEINANQYIDWDFSGTRLGQRLNSDFSLTFLNNWGAGAGVTRTFDTISHTALRGGPSFLWPGQWEANLWVSSDSRKPVFGQVGGSFTEGDADHYKYREVWAEVTVRLAAALRMSVNTGYWTEDAELQYVDDNDFDGDPRYIFGRLNRDTVPVTLRLDYTLTPGVTLQYYGAPFISAGDYTEFKRIVSPRAPRYEDRFHTFTSSELATDDEGDYEVDEDGDGNADYFFDNADFNVKEFNSTLVLRWEFQPGSTMFLVWNQSRYDETTRGVLNYDKSFNKLFRVYPDNVFLIKVDKRFSL